VRVRIESPDGFPEGTTIKCVDTDELVHGVTAVNIAIEGGKETTAQLTMLFVGVDVVADATPMMMHPVTGEFAAVKAVEFDDGTRWEPGIRTGAEDGGQ